MEDHAVVEEFARGLWRSMIPAENPEWVMRVAELESTDQPLGDYGELVRRMLRAGIAAGGDCSIRPNHWLRGGARHCLLPGRPAGRSE